MASLPYFIPDESTESGEFAESSGIGQGLDGNHPQDLLAHGRIAQCLDEVVT